MRDFRELLVWQKSHSLTLQVYLATQSFPREEQFSLTNQMRRSAVSIGSNIAEGCGRDGQVELARFCRIALGSASELEYQMLLARDLEFLSAEKHATLGQNVIEIKKMLTAFVQKLTADS
jgi:four helix bundle protein